MVRLRSEAGARARSRFLALSPNAQGAAWMLMGAVTFVAMTTLVKYLGGDYPAPLQNFYRQVASLLVVLPFIARAPRKVLHSDRKPLLLGRAACATVGLTLQFYSYAHLPLAEANALSFTRPLWIVPLAAFVLREAVGLPRVAAVLVGFGGVLVMLQPWSHEGAFGPPYAAALLSSLLLAVSITGMKSLTRDHSPLTVLSWAAILGVVLSVPGALFYWRWPTPGDLALLALMGVLGVTNQGLYIKAMSVGDATAMAPLDYSRLIFSVASGYLLFHEVPGLRTLAGAGVIAAATLYITWREARVARRGGPEAGVGEDGL